MVALEDRERPVLVAVVQWEIQGRADTTSKLRVRKRCTGRDLLELVTKELDTEHIQGVLKGGTADIRVDVYDDAQSAYISIHQGDVLEQDVVQRFGSRLKLLVRLTNDEHNSESKKEDIKAIMGRFYPFDASEGLVIAGKTLQIQEVSNQQNAGTGVNVWDGALLLYVPVVFVLQY
jgi:hypothetical protein